MNTPTLRNLIIVLSLFALIPLVGIPLYNKQKELSSNISRKQELLNSINNEIDKTNNTQKDIYTEYMTSVLGTYDAREPRDENIETILENIEDIVEKFDASGMEKISPEVRLPTRDLSKDVRFDIGNGKSVTVRKKGRDAELLFNDKEVTTVLKEKKLSLHIYSDSKLSYPTVIVGVTSVSKDTEEKEIYCLIDNQLVRYGTVDSLVDLEIYKIDDEEKLVTKREDSNIEGKIVTVWDINHSNRRLERGYSVIEVR